MILWGKLTYSFARGPYIPEKVNCFRYWHVLCQGRLSADNFITKSSNANSTSSFSEKCIFILLFNLP